MWCNVVASEAAISDCCANGALDVHAADVGLIDYSPMQCSAEMKSVLISARLVGGCRQTRYATWGAAELTAGNVTDYAIAWPAG